MNDVERVALAQAKARKLDIDKYLNWGAPIDDIEKLLGLLDEPKALTNERRRSHGDWLEQARVGLNLDHAAQDSNGYARLKPYQRKSVDMILVKLSRILSGDPNHADHWDDIGGYAHLGKGGHDQS